MTEDVRITETCNILCDVSDIVTKAVASGLPTPVVDFFFAETLHNMRLGFHVIRYAGHPAKEVAPRTFSARIKVKDGIAYARIANVPVAEKQEALTLLSTFAAGLEAEFEKASLSLNLLPCKHTSVWDGGHEIVTEAFFDEESGRVFKVEANIMDDVDVLDRQFITLEDGHEFDVCSNCNAFIMGPEEKCSDPECDPSLSKEVGSGN